MSRRQANASLPSRMRVRWVRVVSCRNGCTRRCRSLRKRLSRSCSALSFSLIGRDRCSGHDIQSSDHSFKFHFRCSPSLSSRRHSVCFGSFSCILCSVFCVRIPQICSTKPLSALQNAVLVSRIEQDAYKDSAIGAAVVLCTAGTRCRGLLPGKERFTLAHNQQALYNLSLTVSDFTCCSCWD